MLWVLGWGFVVTDMFVESIDGWLIFDQNLNGLFSLELDGFARWNFSTKVIDHLSLGLWILSGIKSEVVIVFNEVPVKLYTIVNFFVQSVFLNLEQWALNSSLEGTSSGNWLARVKCSWRLNLENLSDRLEEKWDSRSTSDHFNTVKLNIFGFKLVSNLG